MLDYLITNITRSKCAKLIQSLTESLNSILGGTSIVQCHILNDKRHILTKDSNNSVAFWDILKVRADHEKLLWHLLAECYVIWLCVL